MVGDKARLALWNPNSWALLDQVTLLASYTRAPTALVTKTPTRRQTEIELHVRSDS